MVCFDRILTGYDVRILFVNFNLNIAYLYKLIVVKHKHINLLKNR